MPPSIALDSGTAKPSAGNNKMAKSEEGELSSSPIQADDKHPSAFAVPSAKATTTSGGDGQFPRYSTTPNHHFRSSGTLATAQVTQLRNGPSPEKGTPQDRFKQAVLGIGVENAAPRIHNVSQPMANGQQLPYGLVPIPTAPRPPSFGTYWGSYPPGVAARGNDGGFGRLVPPPTLGGIGRPTSTPWPTGVPWPRAPHTDTTHENARAPSDTSQSRRSEHSQDAKIPTSLLSYECQARRFNPEFTESVTPDGRFMCSVRLKDQEISSPQAYATPTDAKYAIANMGLDVIRKWPKPSQTELRRLRAIAEADRMRAKDAQLSQLDEQLRRMTRERNNLIRKGPALGRDEGTVKSEPGVTPAASSSVNMDNPAEARAFLEGFKLGQQLAAAEDKVGMGRVAPVSRRRSRSPGREPSRGRTSYRHRSLSRDKHRSKRDSSELSHGFYRPGGRDPTLPNTDRYHPRSSERNGRAQAKRSSSEDGRGRSPEKH